MTGTAVEEFSFRDHSMHATNVHVSSSGHTIVSASMDNSMEMQQPYSRRYHNFYTIVLLSRSRHIVLNDLSVGEGQRPRIVCAMGATQSIIFELVEPQRKTSE